MPRMEQLLLHKYAVRTHICEARVALAPAILATKICSKDTHLCSKACSILGSCIVSFLCLLTLTPILLTRCCWFFFLSLWFKFCTQEGILSLSKFAFCAICIFCLCHPFIPFWNLKLFPEVKSTATHCTTYPKLTPRCPSVNSFLSLSRTPVSLF